MAKILSIAPGLWETRVIVMEGGKKTGKVYESFSFLNPDGIMEDGLIKNPEAFGRELKKELLKRNITVKKAVFTISSSRIASREAVIPMLKQRRIQGLLETNAAEYFPVDMSRYYMAYEILETDKEKKQYRLQITAAPRALIGTYQEAARACGLSVLRVDYVGNSVYQAMKRIFEKGVHISLKVEERTSIITIIKDGMLALQRIIPYGVETAVEIVNEYPVFRSNGTWQKALSILEETDCVCKRFDSETGDGESGQARKEITESFRYLYGNVTRIMDYYASKNPDTLFETVSIGGLGSKVKGLPELLSGELGIAIEVKDSYQACIGAGYETINLSELSQSGQKKKRQETLKGAYVVLAVCGLCSVLLIVSSLIFEGLLLHQKADYEKQIKYLQPAKEVYEEYKASTENYSQFLSMYGYTETPNEYIIAFIEELEEKMPSDFTVFSFQTTGSTVDMSITVRSKEAAAKVLMQLRTFESLADVQTTGLSDGTGEDGNGTVSLSVHCMYQMPALGQ